MFWFRLILGIGALVSGFIGVGIEVLNEMDLEPDPAIYILAGILVIHIATSEDN